MASLPAHDNLVRYYGSWTEELAAARLRDEIDAARRAEGGMQSERAEWAGSSEGAPASEEAESLETSASRPSRSLQSSGARGGGSASLASTTLCLQMELCTAPTLQAILRQEMSPAASSICVPPQVRWQWVAGLSRGLSAMHLQIEVNCRLEV